MKKILSSLILATAFTASVSGAEWVEWEIAAGGNGHLYTVVGETPDGLLTWYEAQAAAIDLEGYLVAFDSPGELSFVRNTFGSTELFWTGLTTTTGQNAFEWENGQAITYTKFGSVQTDPSVLSSVVFNQQQLYRGQMMTKGFFGAVDPLNTYRGIVEYESDIPPVGVPDGGSPLALIAISALAGMACRFLKR